MKKTYWLIMAVFTCLLFTVGCKKEESISNTPSLKFVSINPNPAVKYQDEIVIKVEYTDGDGDLGENTPDVKNLFVTDSRNNVTSQYRISQLGPDASVIIRGTLDIVLPPQSFTDDTHTSETATYTVYVKDRAGNESNHITSSAITINQ